MDDRTVLEMEVFFEDTLPLYLVQFTDFTELGLKKEVGVLERTTNNESKTSLITQTQHTDLFYCLVEGCTLRLQKIAGVGQESQTHLENTSKPRKLQLGFKKRETEEQESARMKTFLHLLEKTKEERAEIFIKEEE